MPPATAPLAALHHPNYRLFALGFLCSSMGLQMMGTAIGWELYERTRDPFVLGLAGVARALPVVLMALPAGAIIDHFDRKKVLVLTQLGFAVAAALLAWASAHNLSPYALLGFVSLAGLVRTFNGPVRSSLLPDLVPAGVFSNAVAWNSNVFQTSAILGPILAGLLIARTLGAWQVYLVTSGLCLLFALCAMALAPLGQHRSRATPPRIVRSPRSIFDGIGDGLGHLRREKVILSTITLDLFAVLLGGATALLPVYAKDILHVDARGLGLLRASSYAGALVMGLALAHLPPMRHAGRRLLWCVGIFGVCTIAFGWSRVFWFSLLALFVAGAADAVSVIIRHVLVQTRTPAHLRGRVSAINSVFIESSNELGAFESGLVAKFFGPVASVVSGGIGTVLVVLAVAAAWPQLRKLDRLEA